MFIAGGRFRERSDHVEKTPEPPANQVKEVTVINTIPTANLRAWRSMSDRAPLQVTQ